MNRRDSDSELTEYRVEDQLVRKQAKATAELIRKSKHMVAFSGAGISTSTGILDFRGPKGVWTLRDRNMPLPKPKRMEMIPTPCHMALVELARRGILKHMISQNTDGLHARSGLSPVTQLAELHGNRNAARCNKCGHMSYHNTMIRLRTNHVHDHRTGYKCPLAKCGGTLEDTIVNFGESLPGEELDRAYDQMEKADVVLVLGTSMKVTPACDLPKLVVKRGGSMVLVNLQETPADGYASVRVFKETDTFMKMLMEELEIPIPAWTVDFDISLEAAMTKNSTHITVTDIKQRSLVHCSNPTVSVQWSSKKAVEEAVEEGSEAAAQATFAGMAEGDEYDKVVVPPPPTKARGILSQMRDRASSKKRSSSSSGGSSSNSPPKSPSPPSSVASKSTKKGARRPVVPKSVRAAPEVAPQLPVKMSLPVAPEAGMVAHLTLRWHDLYTTLPEAVSPLHLSLDPHSMTSLTVRATWNSREHTWTTV